MNELSLFDEPEAPAEFKGAPLIQGTRRTTPVFKRAKDDLRIGQKPALNTHLARERVFNCLQACGPKTGSEIAALTGISILTVRPRLSELKRDGKVKASGQRRDGENVFQVV